MFNMYLLVSLLSVFSVEPSLIFNFQEERSYEMEFASTPSLNVGDPVFFQGKVVGNVSQITNPDESSCFINVRISDFRAPDPQTGNIFGLASSIKIPDDKGKVSSKSFLEILRSEETSAVEIKSEKLTGFASFEEYWSTNTL